MGNSSLFWGNCLDHSSQKSLCPNSLSIQFI